MNYSEKQIETAKINYNSFLQIHTLSNYEINVIGINTAEQRMIFHNNIVSQILAGNKEIEKEWKMFFLHEIVKSEQKENESKAKLISNKNASADILAPVKNLKKIVEFGKWLNTSGNKFRKEHFSKKYTQESVSTFLLTL
jgi:hypothetical protein